MIKAAWGPKVIQAQQARRAQQVRVAVSVLRALLAQLVQLVRQALLDLTVRHQRSA
uniref:Uncharacterized protein n=1 Tax=Pseudomonas phage PaBG TaxID=1335230 RepID=S5VMH6_9CAUD